MKTWWQMEKLLICHEQLYFLSQCFQSHLHQYLSPFPHATSLQQTTLNIFCQKLENLYNWMDNLWLKVKTLWLKEKLLVLSNFFFCHYVFKKPSAAEASESVHMSERVKWSQIEGGHTKIQRDRVSSYIGVRKHLSSTLLTFLFRPGIFQIHCMC